MAVGNGYFFSFLIWNHERLRAATVWQTHKSDYHSIVEDRYRRTLPLQFYIHKEC